MIVKGSTVKHKELGIGKIVDILYRDCMAWVRCNRDSKTYAIVITKLEEITDPTETGIDFQKEK